MDICCSTTSVCWACRSIDCKFSLAQENCTAIKQFSNIKKSDLTDLLPPPLADVPNEETKFAEVTASIEDHFKSVNEELNPTAPRALVGERFQTWLVVKYKRYNRKKDFT